ncbi:hypothetical protein KK083_19280 [Fulvivirgaceae bacterium PWU4]|uniref:VWA domain-containing protein n=1 Tax=Chryseosolibacter histidini TaxID=2782349 RepID=A0AAP2DME5_9BACT|nr:hypothetical protein [Chryseosolibacter histidini]MBT1699046.1 hypothetical protein [Chryseosolibacter histidini]
MDGTRDHTVEALCERWRAAWPRAREMWNAFIRLREPHWCLTTNEAVKEGLTGSFAMIRLTDHRIVIDLEKVMKYDVDDHAVQVLAHEIGHHIYTPANLRDNAVLQGRIRWALAGVEDQAGFVANIYTDFIINDFLQRSKELDMVIVYQKLNKDVTFSKLWSLVMRTYEYLWKLKRGTLATAPAFHNESIDADASLMASLVRSYSKNWMEGGGRFAALLYPYLIEEKELQKGKQSLAIYLDTEKAGEGGGMLSGLAELDPQAEEGAVDPRQEATGDAATREAGTTFERSEKGGTGPKQRYLNPGMYIDLCRQVNPHADEQLLINQYYKEIALPHLIAFPVEVSKTSGELTPEGTDVWEPGDPMEEIDWLESAITSPQIFPGYTTRRRTYGEDQDSETSLRPLDVYIGIDCSGSMSNPRVSFSWPVLAATVIGLSALRAGAKVMGCLSGEPGSFMETKGFISGEKDLLTVLTSYLGTGYAFGVSRLSTPFHKQLKKKSHVVIVSDDDIFSMLDAKEADHWKIIETSLANAGGTGTIVLHSRPGWHNEGGVRLQRMGWHVHYVTDESSMLDFAAEFSKKNYHKKK